MTLAQAPRALQAAVRGALGQPLVSQNASLQQGRFVAFDGSPGDLFGASVAISGTTAVVGASYRNSATGAAYVFVQSGTAWSQQAELTASDGASSDFFGFSVALSGSTAVVGAYGQNSGTGAAYVFVRSGTTWSQQAELTASDGTSGDAFGLSVAIAGTTAVVGAPDRNSTTGAAYVFVRSGTTWSQQAKLTALNGTSNDDFGRSVALSGSSAVVGADGENSNTGAAYVFVRSGTTWSQQAKLTALSGTSNDTFGFSVALSGSSAVVGASGKNSFAGAAYVFVRSGTTWSQQAELTASGVGSGDDFGFSVALSGSSAVVGAVGRTSNTGAAYVFVRSGTTWSQQAELAASDSASGDDFGGSVALSGATALVGAPGSDRASGKAYLFTLPSQQAKLSASDGVAGEYFGAYFIAISSTTAVVGAYKRSSSRGAAYVFVRSGTSWSQEAKLTASDAAAGDAFGQAVAISGSIAVVGAPGKNSLAGAAYVFVRSGTTWSQQAELTAGDGASNDEFGVSVAVSGLTALMGANGRGSHAGAAYVFLQSGTTWSQQAELTASDGTSGDAFGTSVALSGSTAVVGAYGQNSSTGAAYVFVRTGTTWSQQAKVTAFTGTSNDDFGVSVALFGSTMLVGADGTSSRAGAAYTFVQSGTNWFQQTKLTAPDGVAGDVFGYSVALSASTAVVAAPGKASNRGAAYMFGDSVSGWTYLAKLTSSDGRAGDYFGDSVALSGSTAVVGAPGKHSFTGAAYAFLV